MRHLRLIAPLFALLAAAPVALAQRAIDIHADNAGELAKLCTANPREGRGDAALNFCSGFGQGLVDTVRHFQPQAFCFPSPVPTRRETMTQFAHWVTADPSRAKLPADAGLYNFLRERYPCGK
ncbi:MAG TPA: Rap1a/Tai family immunity protein [Acetobacteraceae bacterium]|nr:Rap1a/Tai family immunity protein [Acetobacteraceae bacterium]